MNRRSVISMGLLLAGSAVFWHAQSASGQTGWTTLFDGSNLNNFEPIGNANWRMLEGGVVQDDLGPAVVFLDVPMNLDRLPRELPDVSHVP